MNKPTRDQVIELMLSLTKDNKKHIALSRLLKQVPKLYGCSQCGECCKTLKPNLSPAEVAVIPIDLWTHYPAVETGCRFLNSGGSCGIYDFRPFMCRLWGVGDSVQEQCVRPKERVSRQEVGRLVDLHDQFFADDNIRMTT